ncbi:37S ribosomal protein S16 mitochondrial [Spathaspora sp. JA1]|nr:37S ribosomal protein S16 mitochondrial [Spathaspora sp. JA1]
MSGWSQPTTKIAKAANRIRLARFGRRHQPVYNIVVIPRYKARDKLPIEVLGTYNPIPLPSIPGSQVKSTKEVQLNMQRTLYWLGVGAEPSDRVAWLLKKAGILPEQWPKESVVKTVTPKPVVNEPRTVSEEHVPQIRQR